MWRTISIMSITESAKVPKEIPINFILNKSKFFDDDYFNKDIGNLKYSTYKGKLFNISIQVYLANFKKIKEEKIGEVLGFILAHEHIHYLLHLIVPELVHNKIVENIINEVIFNE